MGKYVEVLRLLYNFFHDLDVPCSLTHAHPYPQLGKSPSPMATYAYSNPL